MTHQISDSERSIVLGEAPLRRLGLGERPPFDFWPYVSEIPRADLGAHNFAAGCVSYVYSSEQYQFVNIESKDTNVFLVVVLDLRALSVYGHFVLNLNREYGLTSTPG